MWTYGIVVAPPRSQGFLGVFERFEDVRVQALRAQLCIERLDVRVVRRLSGAAEVESHILAIGPRIQGTRSELRPVVHLDHGRLPMRPRQPVEHVDHVVRGERSTCLGRQRLARLLVDHGRHAQSPAVVKLVVHEVHAPPLVPARRHARWSAIHHRVSSVWAISPEIQPFHAIQPFRALVVHQPALAAQQHVDPRRAQLGRIAAISLILIRRSSCPGLTDTQRSDLGLAAAGPASLVLVVALVSSARAPRSLRRRRTRVS